MKDISRTIKQIDNLKYIENIYGREQWVHASGHTTLNGADAGFWIGMITVSSLEKLYRSTSWDTAPSRQGMPGFIKDQDGCCYKSNLLDNGLEPLLYYRDFYGVKNDYVEISQEFILLNNLRFDKMSNSYWAMYEDGTDEEAIRYIDDTTVDIKMKFIQKYASAKQMAIILYFDIRTQYEGSLSDYGLNDFQKESKTDSLYYDLYGSTMNYPRYAYSRLIGKKIFLPASIDKCGFWPYEKKEHFEEFIIGMDENGENRYYTCDPDKLDNYFGANPGAPMYLTPVFFKKDVLQKYINKPELYEVRDGYLGCKHLWGMEIDNHHKNCVSAYLGDLGRDLPEGERLYWKSFNIVGEEPLSYVSIQRDFLNMPTTSNMIDHRFQAAYHLLLTYWKQQLGWDLYLPLSESDSYNLSSIRIPMGDSQPEFDQLVLSLVKVLIDSLNEKELQKRISHNENIKGISKLEKWFESEGVHDYEEHIRFLRDLQELRSTGTGHRKGKSYEKVATKFGLDKITKVDVFESILEKATSYLLYLCETFLNGIPERW